MSDPNPNAPAGGAVPPKPAESAKVQPKKETVRISLPPKPTSSPTIKLPTLPAGGPPASGGAPALSVGAPPRPPTSGGPPPAPAAAAPSIRPPTNTGAALARPPAPASAQTAAGPSASRPAPYTSSAARKPSGLDIGLGIAAAVIGLAAVVCIVLLLQLK